MGLTERQYLFRMCSETHRSSKVLSIRDHEKTQHTIHKNFIMIVGRLTDNQEHIENLLQVLGHKSDVARGCDTLENSP
jgi:hypothetical protein